MIRQFYEQTFKLIIGVIASILLMPSLRGQEVHKYVEYTKQEAFTFISENERFTVYLLVDKQGFPAYYTTNLTGEVCLDGLCRPINVDIYWDLLGKFKDYTTTEANTLTKFDHIAFTQKDHIKLKEILADTESLLQDYGMEDLLDTTVRVVSQIKADAVTGATNKTFENAIVPGAVYTVYKLWHFVNSAIRKEILDYSQKNLFTDKEIKRLLLSGNRDYQYFLIDHIPDNNVETFKEQLIQLIEDQDDFVPLYALYKLSNDVWTDKNLQARVFKQMPVFKNAVRIYTLEKLSAIPISADNLKMLIQSIPALSGKQLELAYSILKNNRTQVKNQLLKDVQSLLASDKEGVRECTEDLLKQL